MKRIEYNETVVLPLIEQEKVIAASKGKDYAGDDDAFANFKLNAERLGLTKYQVWSVYFMKHIDAIMSYVKNGRVESEPLPERIKDARIYLQLLLGMYMEDEKDES